MSMPGKELFVSPYYSDEIMQEVLSKIRSDRHSPSARDGALEFDARRIALTIEYVRRFKLDQGHCIEIGSLDHLASKVLWSFFAEAGISGTSNDLRFERLPFDDNSVDSAVCLEVVEHISDALYKHATTLSGVFYFLDELYRVLRCGGRALVTTPNAASLWTIQRALLGQPPMMYEWHFREYTMDEMKQIVESAGFEVVVHNAEYVWHLWDFRNLLAYMSAERYSCVDRGDDQFIVIQKPALRVQKSHRLNLPI